jgi:hypothetical protein
MPLEREHLMADVAYLLGLVQPELLDLKWGGRAFVAADAAAMAALLLAVRHGEFDIAQRAAIQRLETFMLERGEFLAAHVA